jgi:hypothetical protein
MVKQAKNLTPGDVLNGKTISEVDRQGFMTRVVFADGTVRAFKSTSDLLVESPTAAQQVREAFGKIGN